ncbi:hypothetical protein HPP92_018484 [Vanilla planifolia]|uniref:Peptide N-acetyl-beta-D-glucosaminyl asparaginase amidase A N-terminal domain-containing protein n=1 Tax=Vanilla planifolia TaxID=51239 RepID=A0A835QE72_VANPL|nr:hypothetical protein HPP92_018484 [Vanilla planifolia]
MLLHRGAVTSFPIPQPPPAPENTTLEYIDPTLPPLLPDRSPKCSIMVLQHVFADTAGAPPISAPYSPPLDCPSPWSRVVLDLSASASDLQKDRVAAIWLSGAELLRTSTPYPLSPGVFWRVRKDITRYTSLLRSPTLPDDDNSTDPSSSTSPAFISMMLENSNSTFPGFYSVNVSIHFYRGGVKTEGEPIRLSAHPVIRGLYRDPADLILPVSNELGECGHGFWFRVHNQSDSQLVTLTIPNNTYRAVLELYVSHHSLDEYWYANPLRASDSKANGGFRQVVVTIDNLYAGSVVPFPLVYPGSINPFFWAPVAAIGAYDFPSYDLDLTPFVGLLLNGREHEFRLAVKDSRPFWLVSGNLHLWLDAWSDGVEGALVRHRVPPMRLSRQASWRGKDGKSAVDGQVIVRFLGWVCSSKGNVTTSIRQRLKFKSRVEVVGKGAVKQAAMEVKTRMDVKESVNRAMTGKASVSVEAPLVMRTERASGGGGTVLERTSMVHGLTEERSMETKGELESSTVADRQEAVGSVLVGRDGRAVWGGGDTKSVYLFRNQKACYLRTVNVMGGKVTEDVETAACDAVADA